MVSNVASQIVYEKPQSASEGQSVEGAAHVSTDTTASCVSLRVQPTDVHLGRLAPDDGQPASEGLAQKTLCWVMHRLGLVT